MKSTLDYVDGYHGVELAKEDRHKTTFITEWERFRYLLESGVLSPYMTTSSYLVEMWRNTISISGQLSSGPRESHSSRESAPRRLNSSAEYSHSQISTYQGRRCQQTTTPGTQGPSPESASRKGRSSWFLGMDKEVQRIVRCCLLCQVSVA